MMCPQFHFIRKNVFTQIKQLCDNSCSSHANEKFVYFMKLSATYKEVGKLFSKLVKSVIMKSGEGIWGGDHQYKQSVICDLRR